MHTPKDHVDVTGAQLGEMEIAAFGSTCWPPRGVEKARLLALLEGADWTFMAHAREWVLRLVWTCRRLRAENLALREALRDHGITYDVDEVGVDAAGKR